MSLLLTKAVSQLLLPPGGLIVMGLLGLLFYKRFFGRVLVFLALILFWLLSTEPVRDALLNPLEQAYAPLQINQLPTDEKLVIVVLGAGVYEKAPEFGGVDSLKGHAMMRTLYAADLALKTGFDIYTSGGAVLSEVTQPEGVVMQLWLQRFGVRESAIHAEAAANNTWESAANIKSKLTTKGISSVILVTTAWHMPRSVWFFEAQGLKVIAAPCAYQAKREPYDLRSYLPRWDTFADSCDGLHEYLAFLWYRLKFLL